MQTMKPFNRQLNPALLSKSQQLAQLTSILSGELSAETSGHYHVAGVDNNTLVIITDSPVWATRLRQLAPNIIEILSDKVKGGLQHIRITSRHGSISAPKLHSDTIERVLSEQSAQQVAQTAKHIQNKALKAAMLKLAKRGKKVD